MKRMSAPVMVRRQAWKCVKSEALCLTKVVLNTSSESRGENLTWKDSCLVPDRPPGSVYN